MSATVLSENVFVRDDSESDSEENVRFRDQIRFLKMLEMKALI